ncbi:MAG: acyltransferase [Bacteroidota bacterium]|nr:acyltransferase [Bacteroidota bacterium]
MKKLYLEFLRVTAAIIVLLYHCIEMHPQGKGPKHFYFSNWGTDAVIIFFILSGIVINISQSRNPKTKSAFIKNRLLRLYPQLIVGLLFGLIVLYITSAAIPSFWTIAGNFLMLSALKDYMNNIVPSFASNSPLWSLSFEMFFYLIFALTIGRFQKKAIAIWFLVSLLALPLYYSKLSVGAWGHLFGVITFSSIWLIGYYVYEYRNYFYADKYTALFSVGVLPLISRLHLSTIYYDPAKYLLFAVFAIPFFRYCLQLPKQGKQIRLHYLAIPYLVLVYIVFNQPFLTFTSFVAYSGLPVVLMAICFMLGLLKRKEKAIAFINNTGKTLGKYSYSIYIIHYPVLFACAYFFHSLGLYLLVSLPCIAVITYGLENWLQPVMVNFFKKQKALFILEAPAWIGVEKFVNIS